MRNKQNFNQFPHVQKTKQEMANYTRMITGTTKDIGDRNELFEETLKGEHRTGNPEAINPQERPYKSSKVWWQENWRNIVVGLIGLPVIGWVLVSLISYGRDISRLEANYDNTKTDIDEIKKKYDTLNEKVMRVEIKDEIQKKNTPNNIVPIDTPIK